MKKNIFITILVVLSGVFLQCNNNLPDKRDEIKEADSISKINDCAGLDTIQEEVMTEEQFREYIRVYKMPEVKHLRKVFDFINKTDDSVRIKKFIDARNVLPNCVDSLKKYKIYTLSKFTVLWVKEFRGGGYILTIIFQNDTYKIFNAWVYQLADGNYELRSFHEKEMSKCEIKILNKIYGKSFNDTVNCI